MTLRLTLFFTAFITLAIVHLAAVRFFLYWKYLWLDIPMHALGGAVVMLGLFILPFFRIALPARLSSFSGSLALVLLVGVLWELFEVAFGLSLPPGSHESYAADTLTDLVMDLMGGAAGYLVAKSTYHLS
ncbi:MAG TPA: hypothetical protein VFS75_00975 [Candidatus Paceibacterota bacterium]|nr:hypothetical protein [Candidatus Paceibacterota bacterium]